MMELGPYDPALVVPEKSMIIDDIHLVLEMRSRYCTNNGLRYVPSPDAPVVVVSIPSYDYDRGMIR